MMTSLQKLTVVTGLTVTGLVLGGQVAQAGYAVNFTSVASPVVNGTTFGSPDAYGLTYAASNASSPNDATVDGTKGLYLNGMGSYKYAALASGVLPAGAASYTVNVNTISVGVLTACGVGFMYGTSLPFNGNAWGSTESLHGFSVVFDTGGSVYINRITASPLAVQSWNPGSSAWGAQGSAAVAAFTASDNFSVGLVNDGSGLLTLALAKNGTAVALASTALADVYYPEGMRLVIGDPTSGDWGTGSTLYVHDVTYGVIPEPAMAGLLALAGLGWLARRRR